MKNKIIKYKSIKSKLTVRNENELEDAIYIYTRLSYSTSKIYDSINVNLYRYR